MEKIFCECGKLATWMYMPAWDELTMNDRIKCDDCVPRGCSCNEHCVKDEIQGEIFEDYPNEDLIEGQDWEWIEKDIRWRELDEGKQVPCCEWMYDKEGFDY